MQPLTRALALYEAERCLGCYDAPCTAKCPVSIPIPRFIRALAEDNPGRAADLVYGANPMAALCGVVCPSWKYCESACTLLKLGQAPVNIRGLHAYAAAQREGAGFTGAAGNGVTATVAVVGAGPAGLACARTLAAAGVAVTVYEAGQYAGGTPAAYFPDQNAIASAVDADLKVAPGVGEAAGITVVYDHPVGSGELLRLAEENDAVCLAAGRPQWRGSGTVRGEAGEGTAISPERSASAEKEYLHRCGIREIPDNTGEPGALRDTVPADVVVAGSGDAALTIAITAMRAAAGALRPRVRLLVDGGFEAIRSWEHRYRELTALGVECIWYARIAGVEDVRISGSTERQTVVSVLDTRSGERWRIVCGRFLGVYSRERDDTLSAVAAGRENIFSAGEAILRESTVTAAVQSGKQAAERILARVRDRSSSVPGLNREGVAP